MVFALRMSTHVPQSSLRGLLWKVVPVKLPRGEYRNPWDMRDLAVSLAYSPKFARGWQHRKNWTTIMTGAARSSYRYKRQWADAEELGGFVEALSAGGWGTDPMPGSYGWPWTQEHEPPPMNATLAAVLTVNGRASRPKAWNEAVEVGCLTGVYRVYDLNSAYAWAASKPMPDPRGVIFETRVTGRPFGYYLATVQRWGSPLVPQRLRTERETWVTKEELDAFDAHGVEVVRGCEWRRGYDLRPRLDDIRERLPERFSKKVLRAFWGLWLATSQLEQFKLGHGDATRLKPMRPRQYAPVWAAYVLSRVSIRCAQVGDVAHVFTDSVMTRQTLPVGAGLGEWKLVTEVRDPWIAGAGLWGDAGRIVKRAGVEEGAKVDVTAMIRRARARAERVRMSRLAETAARTFADLPRDAESESSGFSPLSPDSAGPEESEGA